MTKLEKRYYTRAELAEILEIKENDSHFARKVKETLTKYGYEYKYSCKGVDITYIPKTIEEQQKIVVQLDELQEQTKKLEQIYEQKIKDLDELKQSILQKAFSGEL